MELHEAWIDLVQRIEMESHLEQDLVECLMKWYGDFPSKTADSLNGYTILHVVASHGEISLVKFIASYIGNLNPRKGNGATPLYQAAFHGQIEVVEFLASKVENPYEAKNNGATPISAACQDGHLDVVKFLATKIDNLNAPEGIDRWTPLHIAAIGGHTEVVKYLAARVENPNVRGPGERTPLNMAAENQHPDVVKVLLQQICYKFETDPMTFSNTFRSFHGLPT